MPYRALYRLLEKPPPIVPEAAFLFLSAAREIEREFSNHDFESTGGQAEGRAALPELTRQVSILISSGPDWTERTKRLAALAPGLNIFRSGFVLVDRANWQITDAGRVFLVSLETPTSAEDYSAIVEGVPTVAPPPVYNDEPKPEVTAPLLPSRLMRLIKRGRPLRSAAHRRRRSS